MPALTLAEFPMQVFKTRGLAETWLGKGGDIRTALERKRTFPHTAA